VTLYIKMELFRMKHNKRKNEQKALKLILEAGEKGLIQSDMWKYPDFNSRETSRVVNDLEEKGYVYRKKVLYNGRWTYEIFALKKFSTLNSIEMCPCLICLDENLCFVGGKKDPTTCLGFSAWIDPRMILPPSS
jgi:hypothetical protein